MRPPSSQVDHDVEAALHELGNALSVVVGWLEKARAGAVADPEVAHAIEHAHTRALRAHHIARRPILAEVEAPPEPLDRLLREAVTGIAPIAEARAVALHLHADSRVDACVVRGADRLLQVLTNLLLNSVQVSPPSSCIELVARAHEGAVVIEVCDEGPGIAPEDRPLLFVRGASGRPGGAGIGLSHAAALAAREGGALELVEPAPADAEAKRGAAFRVTWPLHGDDAPGSTPRAKRSESLRGMRVLVVDDDQALVELIDTVLGARGAEVVSARTEAELGRVVGLGPFHAALLDASPLGAGSEDALARLRADSPALHVVLISGSRDARVPEPLAGTMTTWVHKPFEMDRIVEALQASANAEPRP